MKDADHTPFFGRDHARPAIGKVLRDIFMLALSLFGEQREEEIRPLLHDHTYAVRPT